MRLRIVSHGVSKSDKEIVQNQLWKQQSIIGSIFEGYVKIVNEEIIPVITGDAFVTLKSTVIRQHDDPFKDGF